ncbi:MAG: polyketide synthase dehydratase domain-containing protein [Microthrixaceae bacterium]
MVHDGLIDGGGSSLWMYPGVEPTFAPQIAGVAQHFGLPLPDIYLDLGDPEALGFQGAAIVHLGRFLTEVMGRLGHSGDHMASHSVGEWTAIATSGPIPPDEMERLLIDIDPADLDVPGCSSSCWDAGPRPPSSWPPRPAGVLRPRQLSTRRSCAARRPTSPGGRTGEVAPGDGRCFRSPAGSSPAFEPYLAQVSRHLDHLEVATPYVPLWSATSLTPYPSAPDAVRHWPRRTTWSGNRPLPGPRRDPLRRRGQVFVQLGVGSLPSFVDDTLKGRAHVAVSAASEKRPGLEQLVRLTGSLWAEGADITLGLLGLGAVPAPVASEEAPATDDHTGTTTGGGLLSLGAPLVRLPEDLVAAVRADLGALQRPDRAADAAAGVGRNGSGPTVDPVLARMQALADEATIASREVVDAFEAAPGPRSPGRIRRGGGSESPGGEAGADPADPGVRTVEVSLDTMPHLVDHCFYRQPADGIGSDVEEQFPVVPMTEMIEMMRQAALERFPGRVAHAVGDVRALRWLTAAPPTDVTVVVGDLVADGDEAGGRDGAVGRVKVSLEGYARGTVHLADRYPVPDDLDPTGDAPGAPVTPTIKIDDVYGRRMMFHGPAYQGITALTDLTTSTISGEVAVLERTGAMLDSAGQLLGLWVMQCLAHDVIILPQSIERVEYFRDRPVGPMTCTVRMTDVNRSRSPPTSS